MNTFLRLVRLDIVKGARAIWKRLIVVTLVLVALAVISVLYYGGNLKPTLGDTFLFTLSGIDFYEPDPQRGTPFQIPTTWIIVFLMSAFLTLDYPMEDKNNQGDLAILACGSRTKWWLSKCVWVVLVTIFYFVLIMGALLISTVILGGTLSLNVSETTPKLTTQFETGLTEAPWDLIPLIVSGLLVTCSINLLQLAGSLLIKPLPMFGATTSLYMLSAYFDNPLLLGEYLMAARNDIFVTSGVDPLFGTALALCLAVWGVVHSTLYFKESDLMSRGES